MLQALDVTAQKVSTWDILILALAHMKPPRDRTWLQEQLDVTPATLSNWKTAGKVPPGRYMQICDLVGLTAEQFTGRAPLPWDEEGWPFKSVNQREFRNLEPEQRQAIEDKVREMVEAQRPKKSKPSGGSSTNYPDVQRWAGI